MDYQEYCEFIGDLFFHDTLRNVQTIAEAMEITEKTDLHDMEQYLLNKGFNIKPVLD